MNLSDLMDMEFFEKCFFGKKLHPRDQIIFKVYAKELFDIIDTKFHKKKKRTAKVAVVKKPKKQIVAKRTIANDESAPFMMIEIEGVRHRGRVRAVTPKMGSREGKGSSF